MPNTWILVANRSKARIFQMQELHGSLIEITDFVDPKGRASGRDINTDASGRLYGKGEHVQGHSTSGAETPAEHEAERFAEELRDYLYREHSQQRFDKLWVVAPPAFLGVLREKVGKRLHAVIELEVNKDLPMHAPKEILEIVLSERERHAERESERKR